MKDGIAVFEGFEVGRGVVTGHQIVRKAVTADNFEKGLWMFGVRRVAGDPNLDGDCGGAIVSVKNLGVQVYAEAQYPGVEFRQSRAVCTALEQADVPEVGARLKAVGSFDGRFVLLDGKGEDVHVRRWDTWLARGLLEAPVPIGSGLWALLE